MGQLKRAIDLRGAVAINVITMIGIGPLVTIPLVVAALGGPLALVGWIAGAVVALCDGMVWAELSSRFPGSGGTYVYLRESFGTHRLGKALAFLFNWQFLLYAPCLLASGYIGFANYAAYLYPPLAHDRIGHDAVAIGVGLLTIALLYRRTAKVASVGTVLAYAAALTLLLVALAGLSHADFGRAFHLEQPFRLTSGFLAGFGSALLITLYDYAGYADAALLGEEVQRPQRTIPVAILLSVLLVAVLYVLLQIGVLGAVPWRSLLDAGGAPTAQAQYIGAFVVERSWGHVAAIGVTLLVLVTAFASLYGNLLGFSRISFAAARDGAFLAAFARLHPRKDIPHVALLVVGALALVASLFTLDQVIAILTAGIVLIQGVAQVAALVLLRLRRDDTAPFRMPLYPLPALVALAGWGLAFVSAGTLAISLGVGWLVAGTVVYLISARVQRWWPFAMAAALLLLPLALPPAALADAQITYGDGYPVLRVDGKPFFVYGAAFFYERVPRQRWHDALVAYKAMGINTIDLYVMWNWHQPDRAAPDFTGVTDPRRDLGGLLQITHALGFKLILRPGPVIRNEWRNGGYPAWLLERPEYHMPLHDVLEGRYPATATLQNAHADAAGAEWLANATHRRYAAMWLRDVLRVAAPYSRDVVAIALDDDQGAYLDNDTWPAPHWHAYVDWLRSVVRAAAGPRIPLFINTYQMKVTAAAPAWAWGDWYQSDTYRIGRHDLADLDFATGLLQTQSRYPVMQAEFQAGWLQGADEGMPRPSDPSNTALALNELLRDGAHGIVNFPVQDTINPDGWEAPWANWSYAWDAALTSELGLTPRYVPTAEFGDEIRRYGSLLARTHVVADAAIVWPPSLYHPGSLSNAAFAAFADATIRMQRACGAQALTCTMADLKYGEVRQTAGLPLLLPVPPSTVVAGRMEPWATTLLQQLRASHRLIASPDSVRGRGFRDATLLLADDRSYAFVDAINSSDTARGVGPFRVELAHGVVDVPAVSLAPRSARLIPVGLAARASTLAREPATATPPPFSDDEARLLRRGSLRVAIAPRAGARIAELSDGSGNVATSIGLLRDAVNPTPPPSPRDYIAAYTHPLPAGTFNRTYTCDPRTAANSLFKVGCTYDAPDVPAGGANFTRRFELGPEAGELSVYEQFAPQDPSSSARLVSISGFTFVPGDQLLSSTGHDAIGILHAGRLATLRWKQDEVSLADVRSTRGAQIVTLVFSQRSIVLRLGIHAVTDAAEAQGLLDANQP
jgi:amino acid transporter